MPAGSETWDAVVIGAGPAGSLAALRLAQRGHQVLLVEAKKFPRDKVCGGCLNARAWQVLQRHHLVDDLLAAGAVELEQLLVTCGRRQVTWPMPVMHAISRRTLDAQLAESAAARGATFLQETQARIGSEAGEADRVAIELRQPASAARTVWARVVIAADGLTHSSLTEIDQAASYVAGNSRIGVGAQVSYSGAGYPAGRLTMMVGDSGYVGITRVEGERLNLAAALDMQCLRAGKKPGEVIRQLIEDAREELPDQLLEAQWQGTPALTRQSRRWAWHRVFLVGDAAGYVEPFTGEGMSWALAGAEAVTELAESAMIGWRDELAVRWQVQWRKQVQRQQRTCRALAWTLKQPQLTGWVLWALQRAPWLVQPLMQQVSGARHVGVGL